MRNVHEIKDDLYNYVRDYNQLGIEKEMLISNNSIYEELLRVLSNCIDGDYSEVLNLSICLECLYGTKYNYLEDYIFMGKRLKMLNSDDEKLNDLNSKIIRITNEIKEDYLKSKTRLEEVIRELSSRKNKVISSRRVLSCLKYRQVIKKEDIAILNDLLRELNYSNDDVACIVENIFVRNKSLVTGKTGIYFDIDEKYKILDLISFGGEVFSLPYVSNPLKLEKFAESFCAILDNCSDDSILDNYVDFLPSIGKEVKDIDEYAFVLINILKKIRSRLDEKIDLIKDSDFIMDKEIKDELASDCYRLIEYYKLFRKHLDEKIECEELNVSVDETEQTIDNENKNNLFYLINTNGKCYFASDLKDIPFEYISKVLELVNKFKSGNIGNKKIKRLSYKSEFYELKDDQIRIIYKNIKDNDYLVYGVLIKKDDWKYRTEFFNIIARVGSISENSEEIETQLNEYVSNNRRKWSR